jgi:hypothetical protein
MGSLRLLIKAEAMQGDMHRILAPDSWEKLAIVVFYTTLS